MKEYDAPTIPVNAVCACRPRPRKPPIHFVSDTVSRIRFAVHGILAVDNTGNPELAAAQQALRVALDRRADLLTYRCTQCKEFVPITVGDAHLYTPVAP